MTTQQTKTENHARNASSTSTLTQASSISTGDAGQSKISAKQVPNGASSLLDEFLPGTAPTRTRADQTANPQMSANPNPQQPDNSQQSGNSSEFVQQVLDLVNQERTKEGLNILSLNSDLSKMALAKAQDMNNNNYFDHQSPTYGSPFDMMKTFGITYNAAGENIAKGQTTAEEVMNQWMNSPGHRANIMNSSYTEIGIGFYNNEWVQEFIG